ncbi:MAG: tetratricopeptide repeat protein, partial [Planctomycetota bacterium]
TSILLLLLLGVGSTIAALRLAAANRLIVKAEELANQDRTAALDAFTNLVSSLYNELSDDTASIQTREKVINAAVTGLQSITNVEGDRTADRTTMLAHQRLGELYGLRGMRVEAERELEQAVELAETLANLDPTSDNAKLDLAKALDAAAIYHVRIGEVERSAVYQERSQAVLDKVSRESGTESEMLVESLTAKISELEVAWRTLTPQGVVEKATAFIPDSDRLMELAPESSDAYRIANGLHSRLGRSHLENGDTASCLKHFTLAQQYIKRAIELAPDNLDLMRDASVGKRMMGVLLSSLNRNEEAIQSFTGALAYFRTLADGDPSDLHKKANVGNTLVLMAKPYSGLGQYQKALDLLDEAEAMFNEIMTTDPNRNIKGVLMQTTFEKSNIYALQADWAKAYEAANDTRNLMPPTEKLSSMTRGEVAMVPVVEALRDAFALVAEKPRPDDDWTPPRIAVALFIIGLDDARRSDSNDLTQHATGLVEKLKLESPPQTFQQLLKTMEQQPEQIPMVQSLMDTLVARIEAHRYVRLNEQGSSLASEAKQNAIDRLQRFATQYPAQFPDSVLNNPNLRPIVDSPEFRALGIHSKP